jgi:hypothetical protein
MFRGSFNATGIETCDRSLPMFLQSRFHKDSPSVSGLGAGSLVRRPVMHFILESPGPPTTRNMSKWNMKCIISYEGIKVIKEY